MWESLATERITGIWEALIEEDVRDAGRLFDTWVPLQEAADNEVMVRVTGNVIAADLIELDQKARIIQPQKLALEKTVIPKIKHGMSVDETMQELLQRINVAMATTRDKTVFDNWIAGGLRRLLNGIRDRRELILAGMLVDDWDYNRMGIQASNVSFGTPTALKVTTSPAWSNAGSATPITDIEGILQTAEDTYGELYDTLVMTRATWTEFVNTTEFKDRAQAWFQLNFASGTFPAGSRDSQMMLAENILQRRNNDGSPRPMKFIIYNKKTQIEAGDASLTPTQFLPDGAVILADSADFGSSQGWDFANAIVLETLPGNVPLLIGSFPDGPTSGPLAYSTGADPHGNPPGQLMWAVQRGFPRKHRLSVNAVLQT